MRNNTLTTVAIKALPALSGSSLTYNAVKNVYLTQGWTSAAGNFYYRAIRVSNRLIIFFNIGEGYCHTFINGITLYAWDGQRARMIAQKNWGGCDWRCFNEQFAREESVHMLADYLKGQAKMLGQSVSEEQLLSFSRQMVAETQQKRIS